MVFLIQNTQDGEARRSTSFSSIAVDRETSPNCNQRIRGILIFKSKNLAGEGRRCTGLKKH
jgi:hypothetical protein